MNNLVARLTGLDAITKKKLKQSSCVLSISLGRQENENERLLALIKLINSTFQSCCILLGDALQRYNLELFHNTSKKELLELALHEGELWLSTNKRYYTQLTIPYTIARWQTWLNHKDFNSTYQQILREYNYNEAFFQAVSTDQNVFLERLSRRNNNIDLALATENCKLYILEECAVFILLAQENFKYELYPGKRVQSLILTKDLFIADDYPDALEMLNITFKEMPASALIKELLIT